MSVSWEYFINFSLQNSINTPQTSCTPAKHIYRGVFSKNTPFYIHWEEMKIYPPLYKNPKNEIRGKSWSFILEAMIVSDMLSYEHDTRVMGKNNNFNNIALFLSLFTRAFSFFSSSSLSLFHFLLLFFASIYFSHSIHKFMRPSWLVSWFLLYLYMNLALSMIKYPYIFCYLSYIYGIFNFITEIDS